MDAQFNTSVTNIKIIYWYGKASLLLSCKWKRKSQWEIYFSARGKLSVADFSTRSTSESSTRNILHVLSQIIWQSILDWKWSYGYLLFTHGIIYCHDVTRCCTYYPNHKINTLVRFSSHEGIPYLTFTCELWDMFRELFWINWSRDIASTWLIFIESITLIRRFTSMFKKIIFCCVLILGNVLYIIPFDNRFLILILIKCSSRGMPVHSIYAQISEYIQFSVPYNIISPELLPFMVKVCGYMKIRISHWSTQNITNHRWRCSILCEWIIGLWLQEKGNELYRSSVPWRHGQRNDTTLKLPMANNHISIFKCLGFTPITRRPGDLGFLKHMLQYWGYDI